MFAISLYPLLVPLCGVVIIGFLSGLLGTFAFLKKQTMLGDVIAHAALPGIVAAFMLTHSTQLSILIMGGCVSALCAVFLVTLLSQYTALHTDTLFGIVLSVFFGMGLVLLTEVQKTPVASQAVLNKFLFGCAATLVYSDLYMLALLAVLVSLCITLLWRSFVLVIFDAEYAHTLGMPVTLLTIILHVLMVVVIVAGLYAVGVVLMSSLLVAPAVTARQSTRSVKSMLGCAIASGIAACMLGMGVSLWYPHVPTGASIVVIATIGSFIALGLRQVRKRGLI